MQRKDLIISVFIFLIFNYVLSANNRDDDFLSIKQQIDTAYYSFDNKLLEKILLNTKALKQKYTGNWLADYYCGILCLQIGKILYVPNSDLAYNYFEEALSYFKKASTKESSAELLALISSTYGKLSSLSTISAIYYGIKAKNTIIEADKLDDKNPKVLLIAAIHLMHTPVVFGGNKDLAENFLKKSLKILKNNNSKNKFMINWAGKAEIFAYLAQLEILRKNKFKALEYMNKALKLKPNYGFVIFDLSRQLKELNH